MTSRELMYRKAGNKPHSVDPHAAPDPVFTRVQFQDNPGKVFASMMANGRVVVLGADGKPQIVLSRQTLS